LARAWEQDGQKWAQQMNALLLEINGAVDDARGCIDPPSSELYRKLYRKLLAENDLRMLKVQQEVLGCFCYMDRAKIFCCIRSYQTTCIKQDMSVTEGLRLLFQGKWPAFMESAGSQINAE
jgi:hypothetical protein